MTVDPTKLQPGDAVTVFATLRDFTRNGNPSISLTRSDGTLVQIAVEAKELATHTARPLKADDRVVFLGIHGERNHHGYVIAVSGTRVWVNWEGSFPHDVVSTSSVERVPAS